MSLCYTNTPPSKINTLSLHDALPIYPALPVLLVRRCPVPDVRFGSDDPHHRCSDAAPDVGRRCRIAHQELGTSEEHTSELQSRPHLVCRLLLEKKKKKQTHNHIKQHT